MSEELWMPWSESRQEYETSDATDNEALCERKCTFRNRFGVPPGDWRAVCVPPPSQIEATADLLATLKLILESVPSEAIGEYESNVAHAAIARANGESVS